MEGHPLVVQSVLGSVGRQLRPRGVSWVRAVLDILLHLKVLLYVGRG